MPKYYATIAANQVPPNSVHPILANSETDARILMYKLYDQRWSSIYDEATWEAWKVRAEQMGVRIETEIDTLVTDDYAATNVAQHPSERELDCN